MAGLQNADDELLDDFRRGDAVAFQKLVKRHHLSLFNFFYALVRNTPVAETLTQETFGRILGDRATFHAEYGFRLGLLRAGGENWARYVRRAHELPAMLEESAKPGPELDVHRCFEMLPAPLKLVLALSEVSGLSYTEIGCVLDVPAAVVAARMNDAYAALRLRMQAQAPRARQEP